MNREMNASRKRSTTYCGEREPRSTLGKPASGYLRGVLAVAERQRSRSNTTRAPIGLQKSTGKHERRKTELRVVCADGIMDIDRIRNLTVDSISELNATNRSVSFLLFLLASVVGTRF